MSALWLMSSVGGTHTSYSAAVQCVFTSLFFTQRHSAALILTVCFVSFRPSRAQTAVGAQADDGGHRDGCSLYMRVDWKPSSDAGLDKARLERGKATNTWSPLYPGGRGEALTPPQRRESFTHGRRALVPHTFPSHVPFFRLKLQHLLSLCSLRARASSTKLSMTNSYRLLTAHDSLSSPQLGESIGPKQPPEQLCKLRKITPLCCNF